MKESIWTVILVSVLSIPASASLIIYGPTEKAAFDAQISSTYVVETFDGLPITYDTALGSFASQGVTYTGLAGIGGDNVWVTSHPYSNFGVSSPDATILTATGDEDILVSTASVGPVDAVGFDTYINDQGPATVKVLNADGWTPVLVSHDPATVGFFGVISDSPITAFRWTSPVTQVGNQQINTGIDNIQLAHAPIPGSALLGIIGLALVRLKSARRRQRS